MKEFLCVPKHKYKRHEINIWDFVAVHTWQEAIHFIVEDFTDIHYPERHVNWYKHKLKAQNHHAFIWSIQTFKCRWTCDWNKWDLYEVCINWIMNINKQK